MENKLQSEENHPNKPMRLNQWNQWDREREEDWESLNKMNFKKCIKIDEVEKTSPEILLAWNVVSG